MFNDSTCLNVGEDTDEQPGSYPEAKLTEEDEGMEEDEDEGEQFPDQGGDPIGEKTM